MALQFLVGAIVSVVTIMIHALVTVAAIGIARAAALRYTAWPRSQLMGVMVVTAAVLMVAHTLEVFVWALGLCDRRCGTRRQRYPVFRLRQLHNARLRRHYSRGIVAGQGSRAPPKAEASV